MRLFCPPGALALVYQLPRQFAQQCDLWWTTPSHLGIWNCAVWLEAYMTSSTEALALESMVFFPGRNSGHSWLLENAMCPPEQPLPTFLRQRKLETWKNADFLQTPVAGSFLLAGPAVYPSTLNQPRAQASWVLGVFLESHEMCGWLWILETQPLTSSNWFYKKNQPGRQR